MNDVTFSVFKNERFMDLGIYQAGEESCVPGHVFGPAARNHYLFHYVHSGKGILMAPDEQGRNVTWQVKAGQGFMLFPGQVTTYVADAEDPWTYSWIEFDGLKIQPALEAMELRSSAPVWKSRDDQARETMIREMQTIVHHTDESILEITGHLYLFFASFCKAGTHAPVRPSSSLADFYVREAISFFELHYSENITIEETAAALGISRNYLAKIFRKIAGSSPQEFLMRYRMNQAAMLLSVSEEKIADIARRVGYENQLHFSRAFKSFFGVSPRAYRNSHKPQTLHRESQKTAENDSEEPQND